MQVSNGIRQALYETTKLLRAVEEDIKLLSKQLSEIRETSTPKQSSQETEKGEE